MVTPGKKPNVGNNKKQFKDIQDYLKHVKGSGYGYYCDDKYSNPMDKLKRDIGLNCKYYDDEEEALNRLKGAFVCEHIMRKATPEELAWINEQEPVTDPEVLEELRPALEWLRKYAGFGEDTE